jgi:hypothetical protein
MAAATTELRGVKIYPVSAELFVFLKNVCNSALYTVLYI